MHLTSAFLFFHNPYIELICCDGCDNAYHEECLGVNADTLPDPWHCPHCASDSESDGETDKKMSASKKNATSCKRMKADDDSDYSGSTMYLQHQLMISSKSKKRKGSRSARSRDLEKAETDDDDDDDDDGNKDECDACGEGGGESYIKIVPVMSFAS